MKPRTKQGTLAMANGFERYTKKTRRAAFLEEMEQVVPWSELCSLVEPHYPKAGNGRRPVGIERMLRLSPYFAIDEGTVTRRAVFVFPQKEAKDSALVRRHPWASRTTTDSLLWRSRGRCKKRKCRRRTMHWRSHQRQP